MTDPAIRVEHLGKQYRIGGPQLRYKTFRDSLVNLVKNPFKGSRNADENRIWALKHVSFDIQPGEVVGVIGRNGAGKSTLLKVLAHITGPTEGRVEIHGRIGSLLEVGTGFHPELTGRENIYLNGAVLGMKRTEINRKFDEIVDFAEIEKFLETPVKRYSSGMYMRLAFAVAAHLEPEILLVDEVLAVGDAAFQKKCLGKMGEVAKEGRTVLFVSHNMSAIARLCKNGIFLDSGGILFSGPIQETISYYDDWMNGKELSVENCMKRSGTGGIKVNNVWITNSKNIRTNFIDRNEGISIHLDADAGDDYLGAEDVIIGIGIDDFEGRRLITCVSSWNNDTYIINNREFSARCNLPTIPLISGKYYIDVSIAFGVETLDHVEHCEYFVINNDDNSFTNRDQSQGYIDIPYKFL
jgi:lipopolysaccharide transport system ATP-binding protein